MRALAALLVVAGSAVLADTAAADLVPIPPVPPVPTVTISVPSSPVPVPAIQTPPAPVLPATLQSPASSSLSQVTGTSTPIAAPSGSPSGEDSGGSDRSAGPSGGAGSGGSATGSSSSTSQERVDHFHSSRPWIGTSGPRRRRTTTFTFVLPYASRVVFTVNQVSPACLSVGRFSVAGHAGLNRIRFAWRVQGRQLGPGTYRISARTASGRVIRRITLIVVAGSAPTREELSSLRAANTCLGGTRKASSALAANISATAAQPLPPPISQPLKEASGITAPHDPNPHSGVLASTVQRAKQAIEPMLVALLALSILLLGLASLPRVAAVDPRVNDLLARHRLEIAALGAVMSLVAVALAFLLA
jgi:hypothetical protein